MRWNRGLRNFLRNARACLPAKRQLMSRSSSDWKKYFSLSKPKCSQCSMNTIAHRISYFIS